MKVVQTRLKSLTEQRYCVSWLPVDTRVRVGTVLSFKKDTHKWVVLEQFSVMDSVEINTKWDVGGLI